MLKSRDGLDSFPSLVGDEFACCPTLSKVAGKVLFIRHGHDQARTFRSIMRIGEVEIDFGSVGKFSRLMIKLGSLQRETFVLHFFAVR